MAEGVEDTGLNHVSEMIASYTLVLHNPSDVSRPSLTFFWSFFSSVGG